MLHPPQLMRPVLERLCRRIIPRFRRIVALCIAQRKAFSWPQGLAGARSSYQAGGAVMQNTFNLLPSGSRK